MAFSALSNVFLHYCNGQHQVWETATTASYHKGVGGSKVEPQMELLFFKAQLGVFWANKPCLMMEVSHQNWVSKLRQWPWLGPFKKNMASIAKGFDEVWHFTRKSKYACFGSGRLPYYVCNPTATVNNTHIIWIVLPLGLMRPRKVSRANLGGSI